MVLDGLRGYIQLANGLTDVTRERARAAARALVAQGEAGVGAVVPQPVRAQVGAVADELLATSRANRDLLVSLVRSEVDRSVTRLGLVSAQDLAATQRQSRALERRVEELERELHGARTAKSGAAKKTARQTAKKTAKKTATKSSTRTSTAKKTAASSAPTSPASSAPTSPASSPATSPAQSSAASTGEGSAS